MYYFELLRASEGTLSIRSYEDASCFYKSSFIRELFLLLTLAMLFKYPCSYAACIVKTHQPDLGSRGGLWPVFLVGNP
jgi:hypothetical protein